MRRFADGKSAAEPRPDIVAGAGRLSLELIDKIATRENVAPRSVKARPILFGACAMSIRDDPALGGGAPKPAAFPSARRGNHGARQEAPAARRAGRRMRDAVIVYFDAPVVVSIIMVDAHSPMPGRWYEGLSASVIISDLANLEVSAVISREFRAKRYTRAQADKAVGEIRDPSHTKRPDEPRPAGFRARGTADQGLLDEIVGARRAAPCERERRRRNARDVWRQTRGGRAGAGRRDGGIQVGRAPPPARCSIIRGWLGLCVTGPATARNRVSASCRTLDSRPPAGTAMP
jgi:hypothetical protein